MTLEVECVDADSAPQDCRDIEYIGLSGQSTGVVRKTPEEVHDLIEEENRDVVVEHNGTRTDVKPAKRGLTKYVRSEPNDTKDDNLLKQPSC